MKELFSKREASIICSLVNCLRGGGGTKDGVFSVRSAYHLAKERQMQEQGNCSKEVELNALWKTIWEIRSAPMVKMFMWKACREILPTKERLHHRPITADPLCVICGSEIETVGHVLWACRSARDVWMEVSRTMQKCTSDVDDFRVILHKLACKLEDIEVALFATVARQIWLRCNTVAIGGDFDAPGEVVRRAKVQLEAHNVAEQHRHNQSMVKPIQPVE